MKSIFDNRIRVREMAFFFQYFSYKVHTPHGIFVVDDLFDIISSKEKRYCASVSRWCISSKGSVLSIFCPFLLFLSCCYHGLGGFLEDKAELLVG